MKESVAYGSVEEPPELRWRAVRLASESDCSISAVGTVFRDIARCHRR
ncbi:MAG: hypothetical protein JXA57_11645 [Armatimonadetes bacterium]|nr:hypothetical protein [Armatimonadota bacterium]